MTLCVDESSSVQSQDGLTAIDVLCIMHHAFKCVSQHVGISHNSQEREMA